MKTLLRACCAALFGLMLTGSALAAQVEVGVGAAHAQATQNGNWYELGVGHPQLDLTSPVFELGVTGEISRHIGWHVDAVDLGHYSVSSQDVVDDRHNYSWSQDRCLATCNSLMQVNGSGSVYGVAATLDLHTAGAWQVGVQVGPLLYHARWSISVPNWTQASGSTVGGGPWSYSNGAISGTFSQWKVGTVAGVYLKHGPYTLAILTYRDGTGIGQYDMPPIWKEQTVALLTYTF